MIVHSVSPLSNAIDFINSGRTLAESVRLYIQECYPDVSGNIPEFTGLSRDQIVTGLDEYLEKAASAWLNATRQVNDETTWSNFGKTVASSIGISGAPCKGIKVYCRLRSEHKAPKSPSATALASGHVSVLAKSGKGENDPDLFRWVSWEISFPKPKRAKDALDALPFEGSTHPGSETLYPGVSAPGLLGTQRGFTYDSREVAKQADLRVSATLERVEREKAAAIKKERSQHRRMRAIAMVRHTRSIDEMRTIIDQQASEIEALKSALATATGQKGKKPAVKRTAKA